MRWFYFCRNSRQSIAGHVGSNARLPHATAARVGICCNATLTHCRNWSWIQLNLIAITHRIARQITQSMNKPLFDWKETKCLPKFSKMYPYNTISFKCLYFYNTISQIQQQSLSGKTPQTPSCSHIFNIIINKFVKFGFIGKDRLLNTLIRLQTTHAIDQFINQ